MLAWTVLSTRTMPRKILNGFAKRTPRNPPTAWHGARRLCQLLCQGWGCGPQWVPGAQGKRRLLEPCGDVVHMPILQDLLADLREPLLKRRRFQGIDHGRVVRRRIAPLVLNREADARPRRPGAGPAAPVQEGLVPPEHRTGLRRQRPH